MNVHDDFQLKIKIDQNHMNEYRLIGMHHISIVDKSCFQEGFFGYSHMKDHIMFISRVVFSCWAFVLRLTMVLLRLNAQVQASLPPYSSVWSLRWSGEMILRERFVIVVVESLYMIDRGCNRLKLQSKTFHLKVYFTKKQ